MALHGGEVKSKKGQDVVTGPSMAPEGDFPPNPADQLREGGVPRRSFTSQTLRVPYEKDEITQLYRRSGPSPEDYCQPEPGGKDPGEGKFGTDKNQYSRGENSEKTLHGGHIYGT